MVKQNRDGIVLFFVRIGWPKLTSFAVLTIAESVSTKVYY